MIGTKEPMPGREEAPARFPRGASLGLKLRHMVDADLPFLGRLYASTREEELALVDWSPEAKAAFLAQQFSAQHAHYQQHYSGTTDWLVVMRAGEAIGRLYIARWTREHRIVDIAMMPQQRSRGFGGALIGDLIAEANAAGKSLSIHVEKNNPAQRLYARLGFRAIGETGVYDLLERRPDAVR